ncbi:hypothetical protein R1flu_003829 [Riccia fluitans]|uniref:L-ascorbate oxidase n=1 Tax=Riccia fluitans TaxID=41844 RepID=A0ABD1YA31_9MARC
MREAMKRLDVLKLVLLPLLLAVVSVHGAVKQYDWTIDYAFWSPDCVEKLIIAINGQYPGPTIDATVGDTIVVKIHNKMPTESVVIHWHGMLQRGTPWADGAAYVSQCPIAPHDEYTYQFVVENAGTYFYHGHHGMQRANGFYGSLIVRPPNGTVEPFTYDEELSIIVNDWWHKPVHDQELGLLINPIRWVGDPQSLLIEGRGAYNCSLVPVGADSKSADRTCNASAPQCQPYVLPVTPGKTYRLRIASVASVNSLNFVLEGHNMMVVEADGHYVEPVVMDNLDVYSGESYSILFTANQDPTRNYWAGLNIRGRNATTPTGLAVLNYLPNPSTMLPTTPAPVSPLWNDFNLSLAKAKLIKAHSSLKIPFTKTSRSDKTLFLLNTQNKVDGVTKWAINNITLVPVSTPYLAAYTHKKLKNVFSTSPPPPLSYTPGYDIFQPPVNPNATVGTGVYEFKLNEVIDVVLQNTNMLAANTSEIHPWHLHGHDFYVLGMGNGVFSSNEYDRLNFVNPPLRNTVPLFPYGWTVIRFRADNPGVWPFHCHIEPHFHMGMGVIFAEGVDLLPKMHLPAQNMGCGLTRNLIRG